MLKQAALALSLSAMLLLGVSAFAQATELMVAGPQVPAAVGKLTVDYDRNRNIKLDLEVDHLARPAALTPAAGTYVVWVQPRGQAPQSVGELLVNSDLRGSLKATVPYRVFKVFVTPEQSASVAAPTGPELLSGHVQMR